LDLFTKIAYIALGVNLVIIGAGLTVLAYFISHWYQSDVIRVKLDQFIRKKEFEELGLETQKLINSGKKYKIYFALHAMAKKEMILKNYDKAEEYATEAIELMPSEDQVYYTLLDILLIKKEISKGFYYLFLAGTKIFNNYSLSIRAGKYFMYTGNYAEAIKTLEHASQDSSEQVAPLVFIAISHYLNKNKKEAIDYIRKARKRIEENPQYDFSKENEWAKGLLAMMSGDFREATYLFDYYKDNLEYGPVFELLLQKIREYYNPVE
jgi:tetratricopeptide (TPR) repeat protein